MGARSFLAEKLSEYRQRGEALWHSVYRDWMQAGSGTGSYMGRVADVGGGWISRALQATLQTWISFCQI